MEPLTKSECSENLSNVFPLIIAIGPILSSQGGVRIVKGLVALACVVFVSHVAQ